MALLVGKDSGYGDYKGYFRGKGFENGESYTFPALVASPANIPGGAELTAVDVLDDLFVEYRGKQYWLGNKARENRNRTVNMDANKLNDEEEIVKLLTGLGYVSHLTGQKDFRVVTGIPVQQYNHLKNVVSNSWKGTFRYGFRGENITINVKAVKPIAQGAGVYYDLCLGFDNVLDTDLFKKRILVCDMGNKTTNFAPMMAGQYLGDMALTVWTGVSNIHMSLQERLLEKHGLVYDLSDISKVARDGYYFYRGDRYPVTQELQEVTEPIIDKIITEAQTKINLSRDIETVIFASGGACIGAAAHLFEQKMRGFVNDVRTVPDAMSNVRGYWKCGNFLEQIDKF
jgi:plasmid segregation protein ParM